MKRGPTTLLIFDSNYVVAAFGNQPKTYSTQALSGETVSRNLS